MEYSRKKIFCQLLSTSRHLAESAASGKWNNVSDLETNQRILLTDFFAGTNNEPMTAEVSSGLAQVRVYTDIVLHLAKEKRTSLAHASDKLKVGQSAVSAYAQCS